MSLKSALWVGVFCVLFIATTIATTIDACGQDLTGFEILRIARIAHGGDDYKQLKYVTAHCRGFVSMSPIDNATPSVGPLMSADVSKLQSIDYQEGVGRRRLELPLSNQSLNGVAPSFLVYTGSAGGGTAAGIAFLDRDGFGVRQWGMIGFSALNRAANGELNAVREKNQIEGKITYFVVSVKFSAADSVRYYINQSDMLIGKIETRYNGSPVISETRSDYQSVGCLWLPFHVVTKLKGRLLSDLTVDSYDVQTPIPSEKFTLMFSPFVGQGPQRPTAIASPSAAPPNSSTQQLSTQSRGSGTLSVQSFDLLPRLEQQAYLSDNGPLSGSQFELNQLDMRVLLKGGWHLLVNYSLKVGTRAKFKLVSQNGVGIAEAVLPVGMDQSMMVFVPASFGPHLDVCKLLVNVEIDRNAAVWASNFQVRSISVIEDVDEYSASQTGAHGRSTYVGDDAPRPARLGKNPRAQIGEAISDISLSPETIKAGYEMAKYEFRSKSFFSSGLAEFFAISKVRRGDENVLQCERVISIPTGELNVGELKQATWDGRNVAKAFSYALHQLKVSLWRGLKKGGLWAWAIAPQTVTVVK